MYNPQACNIDKHHLVFKCSRNTAEHMVGAQIFPGQNQYTTPKSECGAWLYLPSLILFLEKDQLKDTIDRDLLALMYSVVIVP